MPPRDPAGPAGDDDQSMDDELDLRALRAALGRPSPGDTEPDGGAYDVDADTLGRIGDVAVSLTPEDLDRDEPPPSVWQGILARTGGPVEPRTDETDDTATDVVDTGRAPVPPPEPAAADDRPALRPIEGDRPADAPRHRATAPTGPARRAWGLAAAAAAVVIVLVVGGAGLLRNDDDSLPVVASARLEPLPDEPTGSAVPVTADLVEVDGTLQLDLSTSALPEPAGFYEVWLIDTDVEGMVSLGPARADGIYTVPADVDPGEFPIVDVSVEPPDGDPTHSGVSVIRGTLS
jgi:anti-sigma-K factor RskA